MPYITSILELYFGLILTLSALAIVVNRYSWEQILGDIEDNHMTILLTGAWAILLGLVTVTVVTYDEFGSMTVLAVLGWVSLVKGAVLFLTPNWLIRLGRAMLKPNYIHTWAVFAFALGAVMLLAGFNVIQ